MRSFVPTVVVSYPSSVDDTYGLPDMSHKVNLTRKRTGTRRLADGLRTSCRRAGEVLDSRSPSRKPVSRRVAVVLFLRVIDLIAHSRGSPELNKLGKALAQEENAPNPDYKELVERARQGRGRSSGQVSSGWGLLACAFQWRP